MNQNFDLNFVSALMRLINAFQYLILKIFCYFCTINNFGFWWANPVEKHWSGDLDFLCGLLYPLFSHSLPPCLQIISVLLEERKEALVSSGWSSSSWPVEGVWRILPLLLVFIHQLLIDNSVHIILRERETDIRASSEDRTEPRHTEVSENDEHESCFHT